MACFQKWLISLFCVTIGFNGSVGLDTVGGINLSLSCNTSSKGIAWYSNRSNGNQTLELISTNKTLQFLPVSFSEHQGLYKCVDTGTNETRASYSLNVIEIPEEVWISDDSNQTYFYHGDMVRLTCTASCSNPRPNFTWSLRDYEVADGFYDGNCDYSVTIKFKADWSTRNITCSAQNSAVSPPASATFNYSIRPVTVAIKNTVKKNEENVLYLVHGVNDVTCAAYKAYPSPDFRFTFGKDQLKGSKSGCQDGDCTATTNFRPNIKDNNKTLTCIAYSKYYPETKTTARVEIQSPPVFESSVKRVRARLASRQTIAVYFYALPPFVNVSWSAERHGRLIAIDSALHHEEPAIVRIRSENVLWGNSSKLVLPGFKKTDSGIYIVTVRNALGESSCNVTVEIDSGAPDIENLTFIAVLTTLVILLLIGMLLLTTIFRKYLRVRALSVLRSSKLTMGPPIPPILYRARLSTPRASTGTVYDEVNEEVDINRGPTTVSNTGEDGYEVPRVLSPKSSSDGNPPSEARGNTAENQTECGYEYVD